MLVKVTVPNTSGDYLTFGSQISPKVVTPPLPFKRNQGEA